MTASAQHVEPAQRATFLRWFILAAIGGHLAFLPLLVLLLPRRVTELAGGNAVEVLSWLLLGGALAAGLANIIAGHVSDGMVKRHGSRRRLIAAGLAATLASYAGLALAPSVEWLAVAMLAFQVAFNFLFAPLLALLSDYVPDAAKGRAAGWLAAALPLATLGVGPLTWLPASPGIAFAALGLAVSASVLPLLLAWPRLPLIAPRKASENLPAPTLPHRRDFTLAWIARLLVQLGGATMIGYLYVYVADLAADGRIGVGEVERRVGDLAIIAAGLSLVVSVIAGRLSDRFGTRRKLMIFAALLVAVGLGTLALDPRWTLVLLGYGLFAAGLSSFLAIDSALVAQLLSGLDRRGAFLGVMNLTNTLPGSMVPALGLALAWARPSGTILDVLIATAAIAALIAAAAVTQIRSVR